MRQFVLMFTMHELNPKHHPTNLKPYLIIHSFLLNLCFIPYLLDVNIHFNLIHPRKFFLNQCILRNTLKSYFSFTLPLLIEISIRNTCRHVFLRANTSTMHLSINNIVAVNTRPSIVLETV